MRYWEDFVVGEDFAGEVEVGFVEGEGVAGGGEDFWAAGVDGPIKDIILGVAAIEAVSNNVLVSIYELTIDSWPSECLTLEPWRSFRGRSDQPVARLLERGSLPQKIRYLLRTLR